MKVLSSGRYLANVFVCAFAIGSTAVAPGARLRAEEGQVYELTGESLYFVNCPVCEVLQTDLALAGTFVLTPHPSGDEGRFLVDDVQLVNADVFFRGSGLYTIEDGMQTMRLGLATSYGEVFESLGTSSIEAEWPEIRIHLTDADGVFTVGHDFHIVARPRTERAVVRYRLREESQLIDECVPCGAPPQVKALRGTFDLEELRRDEQGRGSFAVENLGLFAEDSDRYDLSGRGFYVRSGERNLLERMMLELDWRGVGAISLEGRFEELASDTESIDVDVTYFSEETRLTLRIMADPIATTEFRRGDANVDGGVNIADALAILNTLFSRGEPFACRAAADVNADFTINVTDPIFLLGHLFGALGPPPAPGPNECGMGSARELSCGEYDRCGV